MSGELDAQGEYSVDARGSQVVQVGENNIQIVYTYDRGTWTRNAALPSPARGLGPGESPYLGLAAFRERDAPFFFGREEAVRQVLSRMTWLANRRGPLVVSGASGAGKSSLLHAGVLPHLAEAGLGSWPCLTITPGRTPLDELSVPVAMLAGVDAGTVRRGLAIDPTRFALTVRQAVRAQPPAPNSETMPPGAPGSPGRRRLLLVVDQFEQVFTQCSDENERRAFITALCAAAGFGGWRDGEPPALVVLGVRADFEARCAAYPGLAEAIQNRYLVSPMTELQLRVAISGPARAVGSRVDDDLVEQLLTEVRTRQPGGGGEGVLPLLSHTLDQTWRSTNGETLSLAAYERTGGIEGAVAASAERAYRRLTASQQAAAQQIFVRLVTTSPTGADSADRATRAELIEGRNPAQVADVYAVLETFAAERLLSLSADSVEISHEALLRAWPLLRDTWLAQTHAHRMVRTRLRATAREWSVSQARDKSSYLYRGALLRAAGEVAARAGADHARGAPLHSVERSFLAASNRAHRRGTLLRRSALATLVVLALTASGFAYLATQQRDQAVQSQIIAEARRLTDTDPSLAAELLLTARNHGDWTQDRDPLLISTVNQALSITEPAGRIVSSVAFSRERMILAAGGADGSVRLWDMSRPDRPRQLLRRPGITRDGDSLYSMAFSPDGQTLATAGYDKNIVLWDVRDPARMRKYEPKERPAHGDAATSMTYSPDGDTLAVGGFGNTITLWNVSDPADPTPFGESITIETDGENDVHSVAFSPDGTTLAVGSYYVGAVTLWNVGDADNPTLISEFVAPSSNVSSLVSGLHGESGSEILVVGSYDGTVSLWDLGDPGQPIQLGQNLETGGSLASVALSPDGTALAAGDDDGTVSLWNTSDPAHPRPLPRPTTRNGDSVNSMVFGSDNTTLSTGNNNGTVTVWRFPRTTLSANSVDPRSSTNSVALSQDGRILAAGGSDGVVTLWDLDDPGNARPLNQFTGTGTDAPAAVDAVALNENGSIVVVGDDDGRVARWNISDPSHPELLEEPFVDAENDPVNEVVFSVDGTIAAGMNVGEILLWRSDSDVPIRLTTDEVHNVTSVAFSSDGKILATGQFDGLIRLWDPIDGTEILREPLNAGLPVHSVAFNPRDNTLVAGDNAGSIHRWNVSDPKRPTGLPKLTTDNGNKVESLAFGLDGTTLAAGDNSSAVTLWDVSEASHPRQLSEPLTASHEVRTVTFMPDSKTLVTAGSGGLAQIWNLDTNYAINRICTPARRALTPQRWAALFPQIDYDPACPSA